MSRRARRRGEVPAPGLALSLTMTMTMLLVGVSGSIRPALGQSELGRGAGGSVPYPYGNNGGTANRVSGFGNVNAWGGSGTGASATSMIMANPYAVSALNPFLNPYAALSTPATPTDAALYFFAAQQSIGGIGSGQISGSRPRPAAATAPAPAPSRPDRRVSDRPGSGAARYFNRGIVPRGGTPERHYNRYGSYYSANGH